MVVQHLYSCSVTGLETGFVTDIIILILLRLDIYRRAQQIAVFSLSNWSNRTGDDGG